MQRECGYHRPEDDAPCVMGAMHVTKHYFAEPKSEGANSAGSREALATAAVRGGDGVSKPEADLAKLGG